MCVCVCFSLMYCFLVAPSLDVPWDDAVRGVEDGEAPEGAEGVCAVGLGVRLARYAPLKGLAWLR